MERKVEEVEGELKEKKKRMEEWEIIKKELEE